jgi:hypothetical protein
MTAVRLFLPSGGLARVRIGDSAGVILRTVTVSARK